MKSTDALVESLRGEVRGDVLRDGDPEYDAARRVFNAMIDKRPRMVLRCAGAGDVVAGVRFAREHELPLAVRGGGHSVAGKAICDDGVVLDLSPLKGVQVDPNRRRVRAQPGLKLGEFDRETQQFGMATTMGIVSDTGIAGLTLGGGIGWLNGKHGLACDNLVSCDVVTAEGVMLTASRDEHDDLFWALRGGSGNFGVVTSFEYELHPLGPVVAGLVIYEAARATEVLPLFHDLSVAAPDELSTASALLRTPEGDEIVAIAVCDCGDVDRGSPPWLQQLESFGAPMANLIQTRDYVDVQKMLDDAFPQNRLHYWKSMFIRNLTKEAAGVIADWTSRKPSPYTVVGMQQLHGAAARVPVDDTAFPHRDEQYDFFIISQWEDPADTDKNVQWTRAFWEAMRPHGEDAVYVNNLSEGDDEAVRSAYGVNYGRLSAVKHRYDPTNFFRVNQNVSPEAPR